MTEVMIQEAATVWHLKALEKEKECRILELQLVDKEKELLITKIQLVEAAIQNCLLAEKKKLNVPDNWPYDPQTSAFMNPEHKRDQSEETTINGRGEQSKQ